MVSNSRCRRSDDTFTSRTFFEHVIIIESLSAFPHKSSNVIKLVPMKTVLTEPLSEKIRDTVDQQADNPTAGPELQYQIFMKLRLFAGKVEHCKGFRLKRSGHAKRNWTIWDHLGMY